MTDKILGLVLPSEQYSSILSKYSMKSQDPPDCNEESQNWPDLYKEHTKANKGKLLFKITAVIRK